MKSHIAVEHIDHVLDILADAIIKVGEIHLPIHLYIERERDALATEISNMSNHGNGNLAAKSFTNGDTQASLQDTRLL